MAQVMAEKDGFKAVWAQDEWAGSPRDEYDNVGKLVCGHKRYALGDTPRTLGWTFRSGDFDGWDAVEAHLFENEDALVVVPLYLYDHSGITISTTPFSCRWDSGQVGFAYVTKEAAKENWSHLDGDALVQAATQCLQAEVKQYDAYLRGDIHAIIVRDPKGEVVDSLGGYYGEMSEFKLEAQCMVEDAAEHAARNAAEWLASL